MARFIKIGNAVINQEAITNVDLEQSSGTAFVQLTTGFGRTFTGMEAAAFAHWLKRHIKGFGADVLEDYASDLADEARRMKEQRQQDEGI